MINNIAQFSRKRFSHIFLIVLFGILAYSNSINGPFLFDDVHNIIDNPIIKDQNLVIDSSQYCTQIVAPEQESLCSSFQTRLIGFYSFAFNYKINGLNVRGYHIVNILIHIFNGLLVYFFVLYSFRTPILQEQRIANTYFIAFFSSLIFVSHPVQTQAVIYIVQRFTSLAAMFYLLTIVLYIKWRLAQKTTNLYHFLYAASVLSAVLSMKTKEIAFTLPFMITTYEIFFFQGKVKARFLYLLPFYFTLFVIPFSVLDLDLSRTNLLSDINESTKIMTPMSRLDYLYTQFRVLVTYLRLIFFPINQNLDYDFPIYTSFFDSEVMLSFVFLIALVALATYLYYRSRNQGRIFRLISFCIFWFFITLSIESSIIPIADVMFEHRLYLPSTGIFIAAVCSIFYFVHRYAQSEKIVYATVGVLFFINIILASATFARSIIWNDEIRLWNDVVQKSPRKARGYNNLGFAYEKKGFYKEAFENYQKAITIDPKFDDAYYNRANTYSKIGLYNQALVNYSQAIMINPLHAQAYNNRGVVYSLIGGIDASIEDFSQSIIINPNFSEAYFNRALSYRDKGIVDVFDLQVACKLGHRKSCETLNKTPL